MSSPISDPPVPRTSDANAGPPAPVPARRLAILEEARGLFLDRGYAAISMQQIADATGINKATLYHHFRDKDDLFLAVVGREMDEMASRISAAIKPEGALRAVLERVALVTLEMPHGDVRSLFHALKTEVAPVRRDTFFQGREYPWSQLRAVFATAMVNGEIAPGDPDVYIELFLSMTRSQGANPIRQRPQPDPRAAAPYLAGLFLDGVARGVPMPEELLSGSATCGPTRTHDTPPSVTPDRE